MKSKLFLSVVAVAAAFLSSGVVSAETFVASGGSITATKTGDNVTIKTVGIPAVTLVHFQHQGIRNLSMQNGAGVLEKVSENGGRFQVKDASGKWLLITPAGNPYKLAGVVTECTKSTEGCALEVK